MLFKTSGTLLASILIIACLNASSPAFAVEKTYYCQSNLVSDLPNIAVFQDPDLVNPWGISLSPTGPFWVSDNGTGLSTLYDGNGVKQSLIVTIPPAGAGKPTGQVFNATPDFIVTANNLSSKAVFLFASEDGTLSGWSPNVDPTNAIQIPGTSGSGAVYKGLAIGTSNGANYLYAANFAKNMIDVFDKNFAKVNLAGAFLDPNLPAGYAPFNIQNIAGKLYVAYAKLDPTTNDEIAGRGKGFVDVFDTQGNLLNRLITRIGLNAPWGLALAPSNFGQFSNALLVGNFGDGLIHAYDPQTGTFLGALRSSPNHRVQNDGQWALAFGNGATAGPTNTLFFTAGIQGEAHGLFGSLQSSSTPCP